MHVFVFVSRQGRVVHEGMQVFGASSVCGASVPECFFLLLYWYVLACHDHCLPESVWPHLRHCCFQFVNSGHVAAACSHWLV